MQQASFKGVAFALAVAGLVSCASAGQPIGARDATTAQATLAGCPILPDAPRFSVSVSDHSGPRVSMELRETIAHAIARNWGIEDVTPIRDWGRYLAAGRELREFVPDRDVHWFRQWKVQAGDSAVALLTYRKGEVPALDIPQQDIRKEFREWITTAVGRAIAQSLNGRSEGKPMPLQFLGADDRQVTLELRFGRTPRSGAAVAGFALQEREVWPSRGNRAPEYPEEYRRQNQEGQVMVAMIVDTDGRVPPGTIRIVWSDGPLFTMSVRSALGRMRFDPQVTDCVTHPVIAIQPFNFALVR